MPDQRGRCPVCRHAVKLRKDGRTGSHVAKAPGSVATYCDGIGMHPVPLVFDRRGLPDCGECAVEMHRDPLLAEAAYSVSIENGKDPQRMIRDLITEYHQSGHAAL